MNDNLTIDDNLKDWPKLDNIDDDQYLIKSSPIEAVSVNLCNYKQLYLDILDMDIYYKDGHEEQLEDPDNLQFSIELSEKAPDINKEPEMYDSFKKCETDFKKEVSSLLERIGCEKVDVNDIEYDIVEYIPPND